MLKITMIALMTSIMHISFAGLAHASGKYRRPPIQKNPCKIAPKSRACELKKARDKKKANDEKK